MGASVGKTFPSEPNVSISIPDSDFTVTGWGSFAAVLQPIAFQHEVQTQDILDLNGKIVAKYAHGEKITSTLQWVPAGGDATVAKEMLYVPKTFAKITVSGFEIIAFGDSFVDGLNTNGTDNEPWIYEGGASLTQEIGGKWMLNLPVSRQIDMV